MGADPSFWTPLGPPFFRFWYQLGLILHPSLGPRSTQNRSKRPPKSHLIFDPFLIDVWSICGRLSIKNQTQINQQIVSTTQTTENPKMWNSMCFCILLLLRPCHVIAKNQEQMSEDPFKNSSQINTPTWIDFGSNLVPFWEGFGMQNSHRLAPNRSKIDLHIDQTNMKHVASLSGSIFGPQMAPKRGAQKSCCGFFEPLGAILGPRWPQVPPRPSKTFPRAPKALPKKLPETPNTKILEDLGPHLDGFGAHLRGC